MAEFDTVTRSESTLVGLNAIVADGDTNTVSIDTTDYVAVYFSTQSPVYTDGTYTFVLQESADNVTFTDVPAIKFIDSKTNSELDVSALIAESDVLNKLGVFSTETYLRAVITASSVTTGATIHLTAVGKLKATTA